ncbi:MAG: hypothetical protein AB1472_01995 [Candidatus Omnitrophota bacterium]
MIKKITFTILFLLIFVQFLLAENKKIEILFTGETHAMIYPCDCPKEPDGGLARRATKINQLRKINPDLIVVDSGGMFAGGIMDEYTQNTELDKKRTLVNLEAINLMKYDAVSIGDDELNFGQDFLFEAIKTNPNIFLSCNLKSPLIKPYIIKEIDNLKIGIVGVSPLIIKQKANLEFTDPIEALKNAVSELKTKNIDIIILLSHLGETKDLEVIKQVKGIDVVIVGHERDKEENFTKIDSAIFVRPKWQGRHLGKLILNIKDKKIINFKVESMRMSSEIVDDPAISKILPKCFSDKECKKEGYQGTCMNAGDVKSTCDFTKAAEISLVIIKPKNCLTCQLEKMTKYLKDLFPGIKVSYLDETTKEAKDLINQIKAKMLPLFVLNKKASNEKNFIYIKDKSEIKENNIFLKPEFTGVSFLIDRPHLVNRMNLFITLYDRDVLHTLDITKHYSPQIHFLTLKDKNGKLLAPKGLTEIEEDQRAACVAKYYPDKFFDYITCRAKNIDSSWWDDCAVPLGIDLQKIKSCAKSKEGLDLLEENSKLSQELNMTMANVILLDNQEIFGLTKETTKEDLKKIIKR